jgi:hypothetical protein
MNVKYLSFVFEVNVLDVSNVHENFYKDISTKFHVYNTWDYFNTIWHSLILLWIHEEKEEKVAFPWEVLSKKMFLWNITKRWNVNVVGANSTFILFFCLLMNIINYAHKGT